MIFDILGDLFDEAVDVWQEAKHDWYFARRQMDSMQKTSLRREDD